MDGPHVQPSQAIQRKEPSRLKVQKQAFVMVWGCVSARGIMGNMPICDGYINAEKNIKVWLIQQNKPHSARLTKAWFWSERVQDRPDLPPFEQLLQLKSYFKQKWVRMELSNQGLLFPNPYWVLLNIKVMEHSGKLVPLSHLLTCVAGVVVVLFSFELNLIKD